MSRGESPAAASIACWIVETGTTLLVQNALKYLPREILHEHKDRLAFIAMGQRDGLRLTRAFCEAREVIVLAERVLPKARTDDGQPEVRYFNFVVLHEVAHAVKRHRSPLCDSLTQMQVADQEAEADDLALEWFNNYVDELANPDLPRLTREEIEEARARSRALMDNSNASMPGQHNIIWPGISTYALR